MGCRQTQIYGKEGITAEESAIIKSSFQQYAAYQKDRSFFFFRKESLTATLAGTNRNDFFEQNPEDRVKLEALKLEIKDAHLPWFEYDDIEAFGQLILETLWKRIETEIGQEILTEKGWLEEELEFHELFIAGLTRRFVGRAHLLDRMHGFLEHNDKNPILVVTGEPGCGKSALMAFQRGGETSSSRLVGYPPFCRRISGFDHHPPGIAEGVHAHL